MTKSHSSSAAPRVRGAASQSATNTVSRTASSKSCCMLRPQVARGLTYGLGFVAFFLFLGWVYGDVLSRAEQDSYVSTSSETMHFLLSQPLGAVYACSRWALLLFKSPWLGAFVLAGVYTLTARLLDYATCLPRRWEGLGFLAAGGQLAWMLYKGINLYYKNEPSLFLLIAAIVLVVSGILAGGMWFIRRKRQTAVGSGVRPYGVLLACALPAVATWAAYHYNDNVMRTARFQLLTEAQDWNTIVEEAREAKQPSRAVAAYHAIALLQTDQLLEGIFELPYDYPKERLEEHDGSEEYGLFLTDCNLYAGLLNCAYRNAMDQMVMNGPRIYTLKRLALASLLNGEKELCQRYLTLLRQTPLEGDFVKRCETWLQHDDQLKADDNWQRVLSRYPQEDLFEQNYRSPAFLGYNVGLSSGSDATLVTSIAACLYSKDLQSFIVRAQIWAQKGKTFPLCMQEALAIMALKQPEILDAFPQIGRFVPDQIRSFMVDAKPYVNDRLALRRELRERWLGTYVYYYYTENNDPDQVEKPTENTQNAGVN